MHAGVSGNKAELSFNLVAGETTPDIITSTSESVLTVTQSELI